LEREKEEKKRDDFALRNWGKKGKGGGERASASCEGRRCRCRTLCERERGKGGKRLRGRLGDEQGKRGGERGKEKAALSTSKNLPTVLGKDGRRCFPPGDVEGRGGRGGVIANFLNARAGGRVGPRLIIIDGEGICRLRGHEGGRKRGGGGGSRYLFEGGKNKSRESDHGDFLGQLHYLPLLTTLWTIPGGSSDHYLSLSRLRRVRELANITLYHRVQIFRSATSRLRRKIEINLPPAIIREKGDGERPALLLARLSVCTSYVGRGIKSNAATIPIDTS